LQLFGIDQQAIEMEAFVRAQPIFNAFSLLIESAERRRAAVSRELATARKLD